MPDDMKINPGVLETILETKDDMDVFIVNEIVTLPMTLMVETLIFRGDKSRWEKHFGQMIDLGKNLIKTNDSLRGYRKAEETSLKEYLEKCISDPNINVILGRRAPELERELDYFLSGIKSSLDILAKILNPIMGFRLQGWHKGKRDGKKLSGAEVLSVLENNLPANAKERHQQFHSVIESNLEWITYLVGLRDAVHHGGGMKTISSLYYRPDRKDVLPQYITHEPGKNEKVSDFMTRTMHDFSMFINNFVCLLYVSQAPSDMVLQRKENPVSYHWGIIQRT
ncbi:MAG: hypothetical protein Q7S08_03455 [bacterium]|nr:hypothetical protein [bacterium]